MAPHPHSPDSSPPASPTIQHGGPPPAVSLQQHHPASSSGAAAPTTMPSATAVQLDSPPGTPPLAPLGSPLRSSPGSPSPHSPRLSPRLHARKKSFTLTPKWHAATMVPSQATPPLPFSLGQPQQSSGQQSQLSARSLSARSAGGGASARSLKSAGNDDNEEPSEFVLEPPAEADEMMVGGGGGGGIVDVLPPGMMQIAFFPEPEEKKEDSAAAVVQQAKKNKDQPIPASVELELPEEEPPVKTTVDDAPADDDLGSEASIAADGSIYSYNTVNSIWGDVPQAPPDAILGIAQAYRACADPNKVNVCVGAYRDENGKPWVLPSVRAAERILLDDPAQNKEYLPIDGDREFVDAALKFAFGEETPQEHLAGIQTLSGTGACRIGGAFLHRFWPRHPIYIPDPTWGNHIAIFKEAGLKVKRYRYYNKAANALDLEGLLQDLHKAPNASIVLLHACAHNPTGCDPTIDEWKQIISLISEKEHIAFFDSAYQGFASGDAEEDAQPFRYAVRQHIPILLAQSFAKNFGLYGERVGTLSVVCGDSDQRERILSELKLIVRSMYSSPPKHGSSIVKTVLANDGLRANFYAEMASMATRIKSMRYKLVDTLKEVGSKHDWSHILTQIGMFAFSGLTESMCQRLTNEYFIFLTMNGRISMAGLNDGNIEYVAKAIHAVTDGEKLRS